ncbi:hypothetical protein MRB53_009471 [Persea americana]|uniref:Uncharacterized protein n=1 Tax=Persea americana TaxID=3435 RepID=A0ACC2LQ80_PERAE|nr:hypothetical protein MRB53_009471 [Persea americana]
MAQDQLGLRGSASKSRDSPPQSVRSSSTINAAGPGKPLRLVYCDERGKFHMDPEAIATLQFVKGPIGVVSICCRARQGKSYILNQEFTAWRWSGVVGFEKKGFEACSEET